MLRRVRRPPEPNTATPPPSTARRDAQRSQRRAQAADDDQTTRREIGRELSGDGRPYGDAARDPTIATAGRSANRDGLASTAGGGSAIVVNAIG
jgi:hypothetical protein